jgi:glycine/D-amino acid oxidase-like deaminating enzyme
VDQTADVVVIGGGAVGTSIAYFLAKRNMDVTLVEKGGIAAGTSGRCDGNVMLNDTLPGYDCQLKKMSQDLFPVLANELDFDIGWSRRGSVLVIESDAEMEVAREYCGQMQALDLPARILDRQELLDDEPLLASDIAGGMEMACDGAINPMAMSQGLAYGAEKLGAKIMTHSAICEIQKDARGHIERVVTDGGDILAPNVVNAAGIWAGEVGRMAGIELPIQPRQGQLIVGERSFRIGKRKLQEFGYIMSKFERDDYERSLTPEMEKHGVAFVFEPTEPGTFLIGSSRWFAGRNNANSVEVLRCIAQRAIRFLPVLKDVKFIRTYAGLRPYSPDHFPIVSDTPVPGYYVAAGHEGNGIGLAPITGQLIAEMISGEEPTIDVAPLRFSRFAGSDDSLKEGGRH